MKATEKQLVDFLVAKDELTGEHCIIRFKFARISAPKTLTQNQPPRVVEFFRGEGDAKISLGPRILESINIEKGEIWARTKRYSATDILSRSNKLSEPILNQVRELTRGKTVLWEVVVGREEQTEENIEEVFLFAYTPPEVAPFQNEQDGLNRLGKWVLDLLNRERQERQERWKIEGSALAAEQLEKFPRHLPHESLEIDHYKNRNDVMMGLLRKEWPNFFEAMDKLKSAKTESERFNYQRCILIAYLADHKVLYGSIPETEQAEAAELSRNDYYLHLMNTAMNAPKERRVPKTDWQLVNGWIEKNYYRLNETELEIAFNRDWNYTRPHKGNTLRRRAETIGLISALKRGRRPSPK